MHTRPDGGEWAGGDGSGLEPRGGRRQRPCFIPAATGAAEGGEGLSAGWVQREDARHSGVSVGSVAAGSPVPAPSPTRLSGADSAGLTASCHFPASQELFQESRAASLCCRL